MVKAQRSSAVPAIVRERTCERSGAVHRTLPVGINVAEPVESRPDAAQKGMPLIRAAYATMASGIAENSSRFTTVRFPLGTQKLPHSRR